LKKRLDELLLASVDVGSLPVEDDFNEDRRNTDRAILDKLSVGLDYPCYPQLPGSPSNPMNMGLQFLIPLSKAEPKIQIRGQEAELLSDDIKLPSEPIGVERAEYFLTYLREHGLTSKVKGVKACITGPFTVASYLNRKNLMTCGTSKPDVVKALAHVLSQSCRRLSQLGFDLINIDEPFFSIMLGRKVLFNYDKRFVIETLDKILAEASSLSAIHVCGTVTPLVKEVLLKTKADIVDHEFAGSPANIRAYTKDDFERSGKFLAYGCISSVKPQVETVEDISASIRGALNAFGRRIIVKPDCGFGGMLGIPGAYEVALRKLENMVKAARIIAASG
jgi:5-methyltetrahydropteroyltriglutamate--homocysteine methyltransferase